MSALEKLLAFKTRSGTRYQPVSGDEEGSSNGLVGGHSAWSKWKSLLPWFLTAIFASSTLFLGIVVDSHCPSLGQGGSFATGYSTDFVTARHYIHAEQKRFTGGPSFNEAGKMYIPNPDPILYVGDPREHPEIDDNWEKITWGRYILITEEEARATWGEDIEQYWDHQRGGYVAGLDMFHTLHCLNNLRKTLYPDYYPPDHGASKDPANRAMHMGHCIDQMRQYIMCSGDMTPIGTKYYPALGRNYVDSDVPHTCRNFEKLRDWMVDRYDGPGAIKPAHE